VTKQERARLQRQFVQGFEPSGLCDGCSRFTAHGHADHKIPVTMGGSWDHSNRQRLCPRCHGRKTKAEYRDPFSVIEGEP